MKKVAIVTDSNSGITQEEAKSLGVYVIPMPFYIDGELFLEDITMTQEQFYDALKSDRDIHTSQPAPGDVTDMWDKALETHDEVIYIPMSSGLSSSCATAELLARDYDGKVYVVDNQRISVTQYQSVMDAKKLLADGLTAAQVKEKLLENKMNASIYITLETLKYLKRGGRITPMAAAIGTLLNIKPVLQIQGEKLDSYSKVRGKKPARTVMVKALKKDIENRFPEADAAGKVYLGIAYTGNIEEAEGWRDEVQAAFPDYKVIMYPLSLSIACHIGYGALATGCFVVE